MLCKCFCLRDDGQEPAITIPGRHHNSYRWSYYGEPRWFSIDEARTPPRTLAIIFLCVRIGCRTTRNGSFQWWAVTRPNSLVQEIRERLVENKPPAPLPS